MVAAFCATSGPAVNTWGCARAPRGEWVETLRSLRTNAGSRRVARRVRWCRAAAGATAAAGGESSAETAPAGAPRCGFVSFLGPSNTGKSTLMNALVGAKVAIVSPKVQTTRTRVTGIVVERSCNAQLVFLDTPGIFRAKRRLDRAMVRAAWQSGSGTDMVSLIFDGREFWQSAGKLNDTQQEIVEAVATRRANGQLKAHVSLTVNKIDLVPEPERDALVSRMREVVGGQQAVDEVFVVSALRGTGIDRMRRRLAELSPVGPWLYPEDDLSDMPQRLLAAEIVREQVFLQLRHELPYATAVETEEWTERPDGSVVILCTVLVTRDSQKGIVAGAKGSRIKSIGTQARLAMERLFDRKVHLYLHVKSRKWDENPAHFRSWGLEYDV